LSSLIKTPTPPAPDPELVAAQERQAAMLEAEEKQKKMKLAAMMKSKQYGAKRPLLSTLRKTPETGIEDSQTTLGGTDG
jgi:hypothetical protein